MTHLFGIEDDLLELSGLCKALNDFIGNVGSEVDTEGKSGINRLHQVTKLLRTFQLETQTETVAKNRPGVQKRCKSTRKQSQKQL